MKKYQAPVGATSISIDGQSYEVDKDGVVSVPAHADHAHLLAHGYRQFGDDAVATKAAPGSAEVVLADRAAELDAREADFAIRQEQFEQSLKTAVADLDDRVAKLQALAAELDAREVALDALAVTLTAKPADPAPPAPPPPAPLPHGKKK